MLEQFRFYISHSLNDLRVNGQRTVFGVFAIAAGVAAIVSLLTLGVMIQDTLTGSLQESNRGDIRINEEIRPSQLDSIRTSLDELVPGEYDLTVRQSIDVADDNETISVTDLTASTQQLFTVPYWVDTQVYPFYGAVRSEDGQTLDEMIRPESYTDDSFETGDIVISRNLADVLEAEVGDTLRIAGASKDFTLRGIVPTRSEGGLENLLAGLVGYYYVDLAAADLWDIDLRYSNVYIRLADPGADLDRVNDQLDNRYDTITTEDLRDLNETISTVLNQFVSIMGLLSMLIGGIGIVNTMVVMVRRRTGEIAILKTLGLAPNQITILLLVEAAIMGIIGSAVGVVMGLFAAYGLKSFAETFVAQELAYRIAFTPVAIGMIVGTIMTAIFGFLPTLAAGQIRPAWVLRPQENLVPKAGRLRSFAALLGVILALSLVTQGMVGDLIPDEEELEGIANFSGMAAGVIGLLMALAMVGGGVWADWARRHWPLRIFRWLLLLIGLPLLGMWFGRQVEATLFMLATFISVGIVYGLLWLVVWLVGRFFPAFRVVDIKVSLRAMLAAKGRVASSVLALLVGIFTLSLMTMLVTTIRDAFSEFITLESGGNVIVFSGAGRPGLERINMQVSEIDGVDAVTLLELYNVDLVRAESASGTSRPVSRMPFVGDEIAARSPSEALPRPPFYAGRQLNADDAGQNVMVIPYNEDTQRAGLAVGDMLTFRFSGGGEQTYEVVGMIDRISEGFGGGIAPDFYVPLGTVPPGAQITETLGIIDVDEDAIREVRQVALAEPGIFLLELRLISDLINRLLDQFTIFPILVAGLALVTGGIVIANSVALSSMERRREIAVMKAVGLQRERVLGMLVLENALMGLLGGLIGVGIASFLLYLILTQTFAGVIGTTIPFFTALLLMLLCVGIAVVAAMLSVWQASGEKPINVLRYE